MPSAERVTIEVGDVALTLTRKEEQETQREELTLAALSGVHVVVLLRHRH